MMLCFSVVFFFSSRRRHTRCALVTGVQTCALPIAWRILGHLEEALLLRRTHSRRGTMGRCGRGWPYRPEKDRLLPRKGNASAKGKCGTEIRLGNRRFRRGNCCDGGVPTAIPERSAGPFTGCENRPGRVSCVVETLRSMVVQYRSYRNPIRDRIRWRRYPQAVPGHTRHCPSDSDRKRTRLNTRHS